MSSSHVVIFQPQKSATQSGRVAVPWCLAYETKPIGAPDSLMGWHAQKDTNRQVNIDFPTLDSAINFAKSKGLSYTVREASARRVKPRNYGDNFRYIPGEDDS